MTVGQNIKKIREEKRLSQKELGKRLGISQQMIGQYENSQAPPKINTLCRIALALDVPLLQLVDNTTGWNVATTEELHELKYIINSGMHVNRKLRYQDKPDDETNGSDKIARLYTLLNEKGQNKAIEQVELLTMIPEYRKDSE